MKTGTVDARIVNQRILRIRLMLQSIRDLPLTHKEEFLSERHLPAAAESYLRRALEALFDLSRHILAKRFSCVASEYKDIADKLHRFGVLDGDEAGLMRKMAGYRNRMVHLYHEISSEELFDICANHIGEIELVTDQILAWVQKTERKDFR